MPIDQNTFNKLLKSAAANDVSDIHLREGEFPYFRMKGNLKKVKMIISIKEDLLNICKFTITDKEVLQKPL